MTSEDLPTILEKLLKARTKWFEIGMKLKLDIETLNCIETETEGHDKCLRKMLIRRLQAVQGTLTWKLLCNCLRSPTVGRNDVANEIEGWIKQSKFTP